MILQPNDSIFIPESLPRVKVNGAVNSPASVLWRNGAGLSYYIGAAGGFAANAERGQVSMKYANGETRTQGGGLLKSDPTPGPGSQVLVPARDARERTNYVAPFSAIAQALASTVAILVVATR